MRYALPLLAAAVPLSLKLLLKSFKPSVLATYKLQDNIPSPTPRGDPHRPNPPHPTPRLLLPLVSCLPVALV